MTTEEADDLIEALAHAVAMADEDAIVEASNELRLALTEPCPVCEVAS